MTVQDVDIWVIRGIMEDLGELGGHVTGGEVMAFDSKWKQIGYGEIKNGKMELAK